MTSNILEGRPAVFAMVLPQTRVLLVVDYRPLAQALQLLLEEEGFAVEVIGTNKAASASIEGFNLIVLDIKKWIDDPALIALQNWELRTLQTPRLLLAPPPNTCSSLSFSNEYLPKPFSLDAFLARVRPLISRR